VPEFRPFFCDNRGRASKSLQMFSTLIKEDKLASRAQSMRASYIKGAQPYRLSDVYLFNEIVTSRRVRR